MLITVFQSRGNRYNTAKITPGYDIYIQTTNTIHKGKKSIKKLTISC